MGRAQDDSVFVFDEPTIGLHPLDVRTLFGAYSRRSSTMAPRVVVIEHDLDVIRSADYIVDMGPGGGEEGGRIVATGTPGGHTQRPGERYGQVSVRRGKTPAARLLRGGEMCLSIKRESENSV